MVSKEHEAGVRILRVTDKNWPTCSFSLQYRRTAKSHEDPFWNTSGHVLLITVSWILSPLPVKYDSPERMMQSSKADKSNETIHYLNKPPNEPKLAGISGKGEHALRHFSKLSRHPIGSW